MTLPGLGGPHGRLWGSHMTDAYSWRWQTDARNGAFVRSFVRSQLRCCTTFQRVLCLARNSHSGVGFHYFFASLWLRGPTLVELSDLLVERGAAFAVNLDGGGSSVLVEDYGTVRSHPTCLDIDLECERSVSSILCIA